MMKLSQTLLFRIQAIYHDRLATLLFYEIFGGKETKNSFRSSKAIFFLIVLRLVGLWPTFVLLFVSTKIGPIITNSFSYYIHLIQIIYGMGRYITHLHHNQTPTQLKFRVFFSLIPFLFFLNEESTFTQNKESTSYTRKQGLKGKRSPNKKSYKKEAAIV